MKAHFTNYDARQYRIFDQTNVQPQQIAWSAALYATTSANRVERSSLRDNLSNRVERSSLRDTAPII